MRLLPIVLLVAHGAGALTLREALEYGLSSHALLEAASARIRSAEGFREQASLKPNPRLVLQSENARVWSQPPLAYARDADSFVFASQVIEAGGKRGYRTAASSAAVQRSVAERRALRWQLARNIAGAYWAAAGAARVRDSLTDSLRNFDLTVEYDRNRVTEGSMAEVDLLRVELESERLRAGFGWCLNLGAFWSDGRVSFGERSIVPFTLTGRPSSVFREPPSSTDKHLSMHPALRV